MPLPISLKNALAARDFWIISREVIEQLFPFHLVLDEKMRIVQIGNSLQKITPNCAINSCFQDFFTILQPHNVTTFQDVCEQATHKIFIVGYKGKKLKIKGQMVFNDRENVLFFIGSPVIRNLKAIKEFNLTLNDFPIYDSLPDFLLLVQGQKTSLQETAVLTKKLKAQRKDLKRSNAELEKFAAVVSHDLKSPLNTIASFIKILERKHKNDLDAVSQEYMQFITSAATRMQQLITDLLGYAKLNQKQATFRLNNLNEIFHITRQNLLSTIQQYEAEVILIEELPVLQIDFLQILQLFQNLVNNAIKFRKPNVPPIVKVSCKEQPKSYLFTISDNGIGMEMEQSQRIFEIFQRLHNAQDYEGTGIGLSICKKIVEKHGGRIWVESEKGVGSTFHFTLAKR